jgi:hypothetical protein
MPTTHSPNPYFGDWSNWRDVSTDFTGYDWSYERAADEVERQATAIPEPEEVIFAGYDTPSYEGYAFVIFRNGDKFYTVEGGHCSCYGLEGQWEPEEYDLPTLITALEKRWDCAPFSGAQRAAVIKNLKERT